MTAMRILATIVVGYYNIEQGMIIELEGYITIREAAKQCRRNPETVRRWVWSGKLPAEKVGSQLMVRRADLSAVCEGSADDAVKEQLALLEEMAAIRESIRQYIGGNLDIIRALDESRESHPKW